MSMRAPVRRWASWLLLLAFLNAMVVPVWADSGRQAGARTVLMQLCNASGTQLVEIDLATSEIDASDAAVTHDGFCLLCLYSATVPNAFTGTLRVPSPAAVSLRIPDDPAPCTAVVWSPSRARAPPLTA